MSKFEDGSYQCLPGPALIAKALAGRCKMNYTRAAVGQGTIPEGVSPKSLTEPPDYVMDIKIAAVTNPVDGECQVTLQINSSDVETGFYAMGIMLYAEDPDLGEVPYTYLKLEEGLEWIRPASSAVGKLATFDLIAAVGAVDAVSANIDPDAIVTYASAKQLIAEETNRLSSSIVAGDVSALLETASGMTIAARDGREIKAHWKSACDAGHNDYTDLSVTAAASAITRMVETGLKKRAEETKALCSSIVSGDVSALLETTAGKTITARDGNEIRAHWKSAYDGDCNDYTNMSVTAAVSAMTRMVEAKIKACADEAARSALNLQNAMDELASEIVAGDISAPFETSSGAKLTARDGNAIRAHRKLVCDGGNLGYTDMVVTSAVADMTGMFENMTDTLNSGYLAVHDNN